MSIDTTTFSPLNVSRAVALGAIITAHAGQRVAFIDETGDVSYGTTRQHRQRRPTELRFPARRRGRARRLPAHDDALGIRADRCLMDRLGETFFTDVSA